MHLYVYTHVCKYDYSSIPIELVRVVLHPALVGLPLEPAGGQVYIRIYRYIQVYVIGVYKFGAYIQVYCMYIRWVCRCV